jgi:hypothetical protein
MTDPPVHLKIFLRDLELNIRFSGEGDICQGMFEDYIVHQDMKRPPVRRGHYPRTAAQIEQCQRYVEFCNAQCPGAFLLTDPLLPLSADSSRIVYSLPPKVNGQPNISTRETTLLAFWEQETSRSAPP